MRRRRRSCDTIASRNCFKAWRQRIVVGRWQSKRLGLLSLKLAGMFTVCLVVVSADGYFHELSFVKNMCVSVDRVGRIVVSSAGIIQASFVIEQHRFCDRLRLLNFLVGCRDKKISHYQNDPHSLVGRTQRSQCRLTPHDAVYTAHF